MLSKRSLVRVALVAAAMGACGPPNNGGDAGMLANPGPFVSQVSGQVRQLVLTAQAAQTQAMLPARCELRAYMFNTTTPAMLAAQASDGPTRCTLYAPTPTLSLDMQAWICAGALNVTYPGTDTALGLCPAMGRPVTADGVVYDQLDCAGLTENAGVQITSMNEVGTDDVLTDLNVSINMPGMVAISQPTNLGVTTWATSGPLAVRWTGAGATSAVVTLTARDTSMPAPYIVCLPQTNGALDVPATLIDMAGFRTRDTILRVASYRDTTTTAEGGMTYRVSAGFASAVLVQGRN